VATVAVRDIDSNKAAKVHIGECLPNSTAIFDVFVPAVNQVHRRWIFEGELINNVRRVWAHGSVKMSRHPPYFHQVKLQLERLCTFDEGFEAFKLIRKICHAAMMPVTPIVAMQISYRDVRIE